MPRELEDFEDVSNLFITIINSAIPLIFAIIFLIFIWKIIDTWIFHGADENKIAEGKQTLLVGLIVFVVLTGIWGILAIIQSSIF